MVNGKKSGEMVGAHQKVIIESEVRQGPKATTEIMTEGGPKIESCRSRVMKLQLVVHANIMAAGRELAVAMRITYIYVLCI